MEWRFHRPLTEKEQRAHGIDAPQILAMADRVRFAELDSQNHVNNKAYMTWFETLRVAYFDRFCQPFFPVGQRPRILLHSLTLRFVKEMLQDEPYIATAQTVAFRTRSFTLDQQIWSGDLRARMQVVVVLGRGDGAGRVALPDALKAAFRDRDGAQPA